MMNKCGCKHCDKVCQNFKIRLPRELSKLIGFIKDNLAEGTIAESNYWPTKHIKLDLAPFLAVNEKGPWDDYLEYYFECPRCRQTFRFFAETYHDGRGGWEAVEKTGL